MANGVIMLKILRGDISSVLSVRAVNPIISVRQGRFDKIRDNVTVEVEIGMMRSQVIESQYPSRA